MQPLPVVGRDGEIVPVSVHKGPDVSGVVRLKCGLRGGLSGKLQGNQGTFQVGLEERDCVMRLTGTGSTSPTAIAGKFQGQDCKGQPIQGTFKLAP